MNAREVLDHGVRDHGLETPALDPLKVVGGRLEEPDAFDSVIGSAQWLLELCEDVRREVGRRVCGTGLSDPEEHETGPASDLEDAAGMERENPLYGRVQPLAHLLRRKGLARIAAVPAHDVESRIGESRRGVESLI